MATYNYNVTSSGVAADSGTADREGDATADQTVTFTWSGVTSPVHVYLRHSTSYAEDTGDTLFASVHELDKATYDGVEVTITASAEGRAYVFSTSATAPDVTDPSATPRLYVPLSGTRGLQVNTDDSIDPGGALFCYPDDQLELTWASSATQSVYVYLWDGTQWVSDSEDTLFGDAHVIAYDASGVTKSLQSSAENDMYTLSTESDPAQLVMVPARPGLFTPTIGTINVTTS